MWVAQCSTLTHPHKGGVFIFPHYVCACCWACENKGWHKNTCQYPSTRPCTRCPLFLQPHSHSAGDMLALIPLQTSAAAAPISLCATLLRQGDEWWYCPWRPKWFSCAVRWSTDTNPFSFIHQSLNSGLMGWEVTMSASATCHTVLRCGVCIWVRIHLP